MKNQQQRPTVGSTLKVVYRGAWYRGQIREEGNATWRVELQTISGEPIGIVTVQKAASDSWST